MQYFIALAIAACMAGCANVPAPQKRIDVEIRNDTTRTLRLRMRSGIFTRSLDLQPGASWSGWIDPRVTGVSAVVLIEDP